MQVAMGFGRMTRCKDVLVLAVFDAVAGTVSIAGLANARVLRFSVPAIDDHGESAARVTVFIAGSARRAGGAHVQGRADEHEKTKASHWFSPGYRSHLLMI